MKLISHQFARVVVLVPLLVACSFHSANGQGVSDDELEPVASAMTYHTPEYHQTLRKILFEGARRPYELRYLRSPSFSPETLLTITQSRDSIYTAKVVTADVNLWYYKGDTSELTLQVQEKGIPAQIAQRARALWVRMLTRVRYQNVTSLVMDGVSHTFFCWEMGYGELEGTCSSPEEQSRPYILVEIGEKLMSYIEAEPDDETSILQSITSLMDELEQELGNE